MKRLIHHRAARGAGAAAVHPGRTNAHMRCEGICLHARLRAMRRVLALLMLVLLPLLSSWSVASAYCADGSPARSTHLGHHVDGPHDPVDGGTGDAGNVAADAHCDHCHSPGATIIAHAKPSPPQVPGKPAAHEAIAVRTPPPSLPERPNWAPLA